MNEQTIHFSHRMFRAVDQNLRLSLGFLREPLKFAGPLAQSDSRFLLQGPGVGIVYVPFRAVLHPKTEKTRTEKA